MLARFRRPRRFGVVNNPAVITTSKSVSVGTTAVLLIAANTARRVALIVNNGTVPIYIGPSASVTTGPVGDANAGLPLAAGALLTNEWGGGALYAISGSAAQDVRVTEIA